MLWPHTENAHVKGSLFYTQSLHAIKFVPRKIVKWKISALYLCFRTFLREGRVGEGIWVESSVHIPLCHVLFCNVCGHDRSTLLFIFYAKYSVEKTWAALNPLAIASLSRIPIFFFGRKMFHVFINLFLPFFRPLSLSIVKHVQIWIYSVVKFSAKLYDSGHFMEAEEKKRTQHHTYFLCIVWLYFDFLFCDASLPPLQFSSHSSRLIWTA